MYIFHIIQLVLIMRIQFYFSVAKYVGHENLDRIEAALYTVLLLSYLLLSHKYVTN